MMVVSVAFVSSLSCSDGSSASESSPNSTAPTTESADTGPPSCTAKNVKASVERFIGAMNEGNVADAEAMVAPSLRFGWFSVNTERLGRDAYNRSTLGAYLTSRVEAEEQNALVEFDFSSYRAEDRTAHFAFRFAQHSSDYGDATVVGKGTIDCDTGLIIVWSVGPRE